MTYEKRNKLKSAIQIDLEDRYLLLDQTSRPDIYDQIERTLLSYFSQKQYAHVLKTKLTTFKVTSIIDDGGHFYFTCQIKLSDPYNSFTFTMTHTISMVYVVNAGSVLHIKHTTIQD